MPDLKGIVKNGWHPGKEGSTLKGQVNGLLGRGDKNESSSSPHVSRPLSELRDPASFAPPPKRDPSQPIAPCAPTLGPTHQQSYNKPAPLPPARQQNASPTQQYQQRQEEGIAEAPAQPKPWKLDTTGLSTSHLPPPPGRKDGADGRSPQSGAPPTYSSARATPVSSGPPSLPPRLPPRSGTSSPARAQSPASPNRPQTQAQPGYLNQGAVNRLGAAGISVPGLGIGSKPSSSGSAPPPPPPTRSPVPATSTTSPSQINELQSRFSRLGTTSSQLNTPSPAQGQGQGTTWAQKQTALRTASNFQKDPSSVSFPDAKSAAGTASNFHQRYGDQVAGGLRAANGLGQRFGVTEKASFGSTSGDAETKTGSGRGFGEQLGPQGGVAGLASTLGKKKPPAPPPPKKKAELSAGAGTAAHGNGEAAAPPPVPLGTRPTF
ncbi:hypothetical protein BJ170DRAFT_594233 [Xylariales sp. AK1849]|nr:hypothetical protein BJ170DRAFT_594233 [Xylariales sp. AK1849]